MRNRIWTKFEPQMCDQLTSLFKIPSHRVQEPCWPNATILPNLNSSTPVLTSFWGRCRCFSPVALLISMTLQQPRPVRPTVTIPTKVLCLNRSSALNNYCEAFCLQPVCTSIPVVSTFGSFEFLNIIASPVLVTMNSSVNPLNGSCRVLVGPYKAILFRLCGKPNHLRRYQLIFFSIAILVFIVISYIIIGHNILGKIVLW